MIAVGLAAVVVTAYIIWKQMANHGAVQGGGLPVETYQLVPQELVEDLLAVGTLEASESVVIRTEVAGKVANIAFQEGQPIKKDGLLLSIDDRTYASEVERTGAAVELNRLTLERQSELRKSGATSQQLKDEAQAAVRQSAASHESAKITLGKTKITAPFDGIAGLRTIAIGDYLQIGDSITTLVAVDQMKVQFTVSEKYFAGLQQHAPLFVTVDAWPGKTFEGQLYAIDPNIDPATRNVTVKALLNNSDSALRPGMFAYVRLTLHTQSDALLIPEEALIPKGSQMNVMKVVDGKAKAAEVIVGVRQKGMVEIKKGLQAGDVVITAGHMKVQEGMPVQPVPAATKAMAQ